MKLKHGYYDVFVRTCAKSPSNIAVRQYENGNYKTYTYSELYGVCEYISQNLLQLNCNQGIVGLASERNMIIPCVMAATHKCCTTFMFLNPTQNIESIAEEVKFTVIITIENKESSNLSEVFGQKPDCTISVFNLNINFFKCDSTNQSNKYIPQHSFIVMTSGSTGEPKQVQVPIQCIQPNIDDLTKMFNITSEDVIYFSTPLTFDPSMIEILLACTNAASLLIAPERADILFSNLNENSVTFWQTTPSKFFQQSNLHIKSKILSETSPLKTLALGGEPLNGISLLKELKHCNNKTRIFTLYGVTEMSCWACVAELDLNKIQSDKEVPLGDCLSETQLVVEPQEDNNNTGKIVLVSKTRKCAIINKTNGNEEESSLRFLNTGDLGEVKNGRVYYRGRVDEVIKRFGHKINLQLIESTIMQCPKVRGCSCIWLPVPLLLVVYFSSESLSSQEVSHFIKCKLNDKHWPDKVIRVNCLPTNSHGKTSKQLLTRAFEKSLFESVNKDVKSIFLKELKMIMNKNYCFDEIKDRSFFSLGGTSFMAVTMCNKLSLYHTQFNKLILPYLLSEKYTIGSIIGITENEFSLEEMKSKGFKRTRSVTDNCTYKKSQKNTYCNYIFSIEWTFDTGKCVDASPVLLKTNEKLYAIVGSHSGKVIVMDAVLGTLKGMIKLLTRVEAPVLCTEDSTATHRGVVGTYDGTVICFAIESCKEMWRVNIGSMVKSKSVCCNGLVYVASYDGNVRCIDFETGVITNIIQITDNAISADLILAKNKFILLGTLSGVCASINTNCNTVVWRGNTGSPIFANPALYDNEKFVIFAEVTGKIHCRTVEKGIKVWEYNGAKGNVFSSIFVKAVDTVNWQLVFGCHDNCVYSVLIKNFQPSLHWKVALTSPVYSTPCALTDTNILAISSNGVLCIIDVLNGRLITDFKLPGEIFSSPVVHENLIYVGCRNDLLYALKFIS